MSPAEVFALVERAQHELQQREPFVAWRRALGQSDELLDALRVRDLKGPVLHPGIVRNTGEAGDARTGLRTCVPPVALGNCHGSQLLARGWSDDKVVCLCNRALAQQLEELVEATDGGARWTARGRHTQRGSVGLGREQAGEEVL